MHRQFLLCAVMAMLAPAGARLNGEAATPHRIYIRIAAWLAEGIDMD
jgi:hypothetical protein